MARKPENRGTCAYCDEVLTRRSFNNHLDVCAGRENALTLAVKSKRPEETLWHVRVQDAYSKDFFIDLEINGSARLSHLDDYLRAIWLECCGHFSVGSKLLQVRLTCLRCFEAALNLIWKRRPLYA